MDENERSSLHTLWAPLGESNAPGQAQGAEAMPELQEPILEPSKKDIDYEAERDRRWKLKADAGIAFTRAKALGLIRAPERCSRCGYALPLEGHHTDYSKPLDVTWVCSTCHHDIHRQYRKQQKRERPDGRRPTAGDTVLWRYGPLLIRMRVIDVKLAYGQERYLVRPTDGEGEGWVKDVRFERQSTEQGWDNE